MRRRSPSLAPGTVRRLLTLLLFIVVQLAAAQTQEVVARHVRVIFEDPALEGYARRVAATAEEALGRVADLFGVEPGPVVLNLDGDSDTFNAFAFPLPRPGVELRALFPVLGPVGFRAEDLTRLLLLHELTHVVQFAFDEGIPGAEGLPRLGLVGETVAAPPPSWFIEGIATWVESEFTAGGRRDEARTRGLLEQLALEGSWPSLTEAGLGTHASWPGGETRYLLGVGFVAYLMDRYGFDALLETLRRYNAGTPFTPFASAWRRVTGEPLADAWGAWHQELVAAAEDRGAEVEPAPRLTDSGWYTGLPAVSPDGTRVAWASWPPGLTVAELDDDGLSGERVVLPRRPESLAWLDDHTLLYTRNLRQPGRDLTGVFAFDLRSGRERRLSEGAGAHLPRPTPDGCVLFVRDLVSQGAGLHRLCGGTSEQLWRAPESQHIVGLAVSPGGRVAMSLWFGGRVDLALFEGGEVEALTRSPAQELSPAWLDEDTLLFSSDAGGLFDLYTLRLTGAGELRRLTRSPGGAFEPAPAGQRVLFAELGPRGFDLALVQLGFEDVGPAPLPADTVDAATEAPPPAGADLEVRRYDPLPSLVPYGWLPTDAGFSLAPLGAALELSVLGEDASERFRYALSVGYDSTLEGHLAGAWTGLRLDIGSRPQPDLRGGDPLTFGIELGGWPHRPHLASRSETALGGRGRLVATLPLDRWTARLGLEVGLVHLQSYGALQPEAGFGASLSRQFADLYGYRTRGPRFGV